MPTNIVTVGFLPIKLSDDHWKDTVTKEFVCPVCSGLVCPYCQKIGI